MALTACRECAKEVSTEAAACPHCGAAAPARERSEEWTPCPKCGSANTQRIGPGLTGCILFAFGRCLLWISLLVEFVDGERRLVWNLSGNRTHADSVE